MKVLGRDLAIWAEGAEGWQLIGCEKSCEVNVEAEIKTITGKTLGQWSKKRPIRLGWSISTNNLFAQGTFDKLFESLVSMKPIKVSFSPIRRTIYGITYDDSKRYVGDAYIQSLGGSADMADIGRLSVSLVGDGPLEKVKNESTGIFDFTFDDKFE